LCHYDPNATTTINRFSDCLFNMNDWSVYASPESRFRSSVTDHSNTNCVVMTLMRQRPSIASVIVYSIWMIEVFMLHQKVGFEAQTLIIQMHKNNLTNRMDKLCRYDPNAQQPSIASTIFYWIWLIDVFMLHQKVSSEAQTVTIQMHNNNLTNRMANCVIMTLMRQQPSISSVIVYSIWMIEMFMLHQKVGSEA
jgi:hypothetical protein